MIRIAHLNVRSQIDKNALRFSQMQWILLIVFMFLKMCDNSKKIYN